MGIIRVGIRLGRGRFFPPADTNGLRENTWEGRKTFMVAQNPTLKETGAACHGLKL